MFSKQLSKIIVVSFILNFSHMLEVVLSGFAKNAYITIGNYFSTTSEAIYYFSHIPLYIFFVLFFLSHAHKKFLKYCLILYTWVFISESHHFLRALAQVDYYPGAITSFLYLVLGIFYIKQLHFDLKKFK